MKQTKNPVIHWDVQKRVMPKNDPGMKLQPRFPVARAGFLQVSLQEEERVKDRYPHSEREKDGMNCGLIPSRLERENSKYQDGCECVCVCV